MADTADTALQHMWTLMFDYVLTKGVRVRNDIIRKMLVFCRRRETAQARKLIRHALAREPIMRLGSIFQLAAHVGGPDMTRKVAQGLKRLELKNPTEFHNRFLKF